jgi:ABC-2 type transport system ATP-binding protein
LTAITPALALHGLTRRFGDVVAVDDLTFDVAPGELFAIVGPDGAGKTTTMRMLAGVVRPSGGDAIVNGVSVASDPEGVKPHIAYMSQRFGLYTDLTVRENIEFYADLYQVPPHMRPARIERLYAFSQLGPFENRLAGQLSGGMKQKLSLSCALIHHPTVMLLDEPTFGVDPISRRDLWLIVHQMVADGTTVVVSTAYLDEAERCDRVALLHEGQVVALDDPQSLQRLWEGRILSLRADDPRALRDALQRIPQVQGATLFGNSVHAVVSNVEEDWPALSAAIDAAGIRVTYKEIVEPSLEDVFIDTVTGVEQPSG